MAHWMLFKVSYVRKVSGDSTEDCGLISVSLDKEGLIRWLMHIVPDSQSCAINRNVVFHIRAGQGISDSAITIGQSDRYI
jgi:hypothetical protein